MAGSQLNRRKSVEMTLDVLDGCTAYSLYNIRPPSFIITSIDRENDSMRLRRGTGQFEPPLFCFRSQTCLLNRPVGLAVWLTYHLTLAYSPTTNSKSLITPVVIDPDRSFLPLSMTGSAPAVQDLSTTSLS